MKTLLHRYIKGEATEEEKRKVIQWLDENPEHIREYKAMHKLYDISLWSQPEAIGEERDSRKNVIRRLSLEFLKIAAALLIGLAAAWQLFYNEMDAPHTQTFYAPTGQRAELTLADGTKVWLNAGSTLRFPDRFDKDSRNVELDGEGYFDVTHDKDRPFTVQTKKFAIHVLGTEFNVRAYSNSDSYETALIEGSVEVTMDQSERSVRLKPNEVLSMDKGKLTMGTISDHNYFRWKEGLFCFENETVAGLIEKIEIYYDVHIDMQNKSLLNHRYSGKFRIKDGVEHVLKVLQLEHTFSYTKNDKLNSITIK